MFIFYFVFMSGIRCSRIFLFYPKSLKNICLAFNFNFHLSYNQKPRLILFNIIIIRKTSRLQCISALHLKQCNTVRPNFLFVIVVLWGFLLDIFFLVQKNYIIERKINMKSILPVNIISIRRLARR